MSFPFDNGPSASGDWLPIVLPVYLAIWLGNLALVLRRPDYDGITRLTWAIVIIFVPFFGLFLYWFIAPGARSRVVDSSNEVAGTPWEQNPDHVAKND
jgi:hypothetical protein